MENQNDMFNQIINEGVAEFSNLSLDTINAMCGQNFKLTLENTKLTKSSFSGISAISHFFGEVQGFYILSISEQNLFKLLGWSQQQFNDSKMEALEFLNEILNISVAQSLPILEKYLSNLTYSPATICHGEIYLPNYLSSHYLIKNQNDNILECALYINRAEVKISHEFVKMQENLKVKSIEAHTDSLTGLNNRNCLNDTLPEIIQKTIDLKQGISLYWIDLDYFKEINDTYGHQIGDVALSKMGSVLSSCLANDDICFRYGGDEFLFLLPNKSINEAYKSAQQFKDKIESIAIKVSCSPPKEIFLSVSIGVVSLRENETHEDFLKRADICLYHAKETGRGRISIDDLIEN